MLIRLATYEQTGEDLPGRGVFAGRNGSERLASTRKRQWLGVTKAVKQVESPELKRILKSSSNQII